MEGKGGGIYISNSKKKTKKKNTFLSVCTKSEMLSAYYTAPFSSLSRDVTGADFHLQTSAYLLEIGA